MDNRMKRLVNLQSQLVEARNHNELDQFIIDQHEEIDRLLTDYMWVESRAMDKNEFHSELDRLSKLNDAMAIELAKWDPAWGDYKAEVKADEGQEELVRELVEAVERGAA